MEASTQFWCHCITQSRCDLNSQIDCYVADETVQFVPLLALFDLLTELILSIPTFLKILLSSRPQGDAPSMVSIFQNVVLEQLSPEKNLANSELACSLLRLLESICFHPSPSSTKQCVSSLLLGMLFTRILYRLQLLFQNRDILIHLVQSSHPVWFLERSFRLLALLSTRAQIHLTSFILCRL